MSDTVFILGAGFSYDAGIPLLGGFIQKMWEFSVRKKANGEPLDEGDIVIFESALETINELDSYHGRANFDDRNIEDVLSILSFNSLSGKKKDTVKLSRMNQAIARTIELSCLVKHGGVVEPHLTRPHAHSGPQIYKQFWAALFRAMKLGHEMPTLVSFNYDLVLERALLQTLIGTQYHSNEKLPFENLQVDYHYNKDSAVDYQVEFQQYRTMKRHDLEIEFGTNLRQMALGGKLTGTRIDFLKLHGSLNFPRVQKGFGDGNRFNLTDSVEDPFILPPIFNKSTGGNASAMWRKAHQELRNAKNVVIVGYSLPRTDIYMQYFVKSALGPNLNLNKIIVFDPILYQDNESEKAMRGRYRECFAPQLESRIVFEPNFDLNHKSKNLLQSSFDQSEARGTTHHFVHTLSKWPGALLF